MAPEAAARAAIRLREPSRPLSLGVLIGAEVVVSSAALLARLGLGAGLSPITLAAWRLVVASLIVVGIGAARRHASGTPPSAVAWPVAIRLSAAGILLGIHFASWFASLQTISVARSTLLVSTTPLWAGLAAVAMRQRLPVTFWLGLVVAAAGLVLVTGRAAGAMAVSAGDGWALVGAATVAGYLVLVQDDQGRLGTGRVVAWTYAAAAATMAAFAVAALRPAALWPPTSVAWLAIGGMAVGPQLVGHTALNWSLKRFRAGAVAAATLLEPVFASALAWWLLHERVTAVQALGGAVLLVGVAVSLIRTHRTVAI